MADNEELEVTESPELADEQEATDAEVVFVEPREVIEKGECEPCPSMAPAWMATFADMATLLMAFFVLILSFTEMEDPSIFKEVSGSMSDSFGVQREVPSVEPPMAQNIIAKSFRTSRNIMHLSLRGVSCFLGAMAPEASTDPKCPRNSNAQVRSVRIRNVRSTIDSHSWPTVSGL